jgi:hypothetical protein
VATERFSELLQEVGKTWVSIAALVVAALYSVGFLSLHFHLHVLGVRTEGHVVDTMYLISGGRALLWLLPVTILVSLPSMLIVWLTKPLRTRWSTICASRRNWRNATEIAQAAFAAVLTIAMTSTLTPGDVLRQPTTATAAGTGGPSAQSMWLAMLSDDAMKVIAAMAAAGVTLFTGVLTVSRWRRGLGADPISGILVLILVMDGVLLAGLNGVYFIPKTLEQLRPAPAAISGATQRVWLVHRGISKATLFFCTAGGERVLTTIPIDQLDGIALSAPQPFAAITGQDQCASKPR